VYIIYLKYKYQHISNFNLLCRDCTSDTFLSNVAINAIDIKKRFAYLFFTRLKYSVQIFSLQGIILGALLFLFIYFLVNGSDVKM